MTAFSVVFAPDRAQYCVQGANGLRVYPMPMPYSDPDAAKRAAQLCEVLNRMERNADPMPAVVAGKGCWSAGVAALQKEAESTPDIPPDYCHACDLAVYGKRGATGTEQGRECLRCPECGAQVAEGTAI